MVAAAIRTIIAQPSLAQVRGQLGVIAGMLDCCSLVEQAKG
jgi:hypothetical protein